MILPVIYTALTVLGCRLLIQKAWEIDGQGNIKVNAWIAACIMAGAIFDMLREILQ